MKLKEFQYYFPNADMSRFEEIDCAVVYNKLDDVEEPVFWQNDEAVFDLHLDFNEYASYYEDKNEFFKKFKARKKYTVKKEISNFPIEWSVKTNENPADIVLKLQDVDFENFRIYVNSKDFFMINDTFPDFGNVSKIDWNDSKNAYTLSLKAMYVLSYLGGMSMDNLKSENVIAKSLAYFYFYYHLKKFYNYRDFSGFDFIELKKIPWSLYNWQHHFVWYHSQIDYTPQNLKRTKDEIVDHIHRDGRKLRYDTRLGKRDIGKDYLKLIVKEGKGLTKIGQRLFQESNQAYVYCVLGSQAKTRWKIVGDGANSYQTQQVFKSLVDEIVSQNNLSMIIKSMRLAIQQTKVRLDFVISPGLEILSSKMIYIKDSPGHNNVLRISTKNLKFGENGNVNSSQIPSESVSNENPVKKQVETSLVVTKNKQSTNNGAVLLSGAFIAILGRLLWIAL